MSPDSKLRDEMRTTPAGLLLLRCGFEPYDTESSARRVAEKAAEEIAAANARAEATGLRVSFLEKRIEEMDRLHHACLDASCECYSDPDGVCVHCNRSIKLSDRAEKTQEEADAVYAERDALAARVATLRALLADACGSLRSLREAENEDAKRAGRNIPWPPEFPPVPVRFTEALADTERYEPLRPDEYLPTYPHMWTEKLYVTNGTIDNPQPGFREFFGSGGHYVRDYGYTIYRKVA